MAKLLLSPHQITTLSHAKITTFVLQSAAFFSSSIVAPSGARRIIGNVSTLTVNPTSRRVFSTRASEKDVDVGEEKEGTSVVSDDKLEGNGGLGMKGRSGEEEYPTGEFEMEEFNLWRTFFVKVRMLFAFPWERVKKGSVLSIKLKGRISDQLASRFSSRLSLPQICENLTKAAYDPRISGVYIQIEPLSCGWGKIEEIRRHILNFKKSGKKREEIENFLNSGVFQVERLKEEGWITNLMYDDEITSMLKERLGVNKEIKLSIVDYSTLKLEDGLLGSQVARTRLQ